MDLDAKVARFHELRCSLITTEERAAVLFCRMIYGNGFQALSDELSDLDDYDEKDQERMMEDALHYLEELAKSEISDAIDSKLKEV